jgi:hypothetical protein
MSFSPGWASGINAGAGLVSSYKANKRADEKEKRDAELHTARKDYYDEAKGKLSGPKGGDAAAEGAADYSLAPAPKGSGATGLRLPSWQGSLSMPDMGGQSEAPQAEAAAPALGASEMFMGRLGRGYESLWAGFSNVEGY